MRYVPSFRYLTRVLYEEKKIDLFTRVVIQMGSVANGPLVYHLHNHLFEMLSILQINSFQ